MRFLFLPLRAQYAAITCAIVAVAVVVLVAGYFGLSQLYDFAARSRMPPAARAELEALDSRDEDEMSAVDMQRWLDLNQEYYLWPSTAINAAMLISIAVVVLVLTGGVGFALANRFGRPVASVALAAQHIAKGELTARAKVERTLNAELAALLSNFNAMASQLESAEKERRTITAAIAHELRTPLTIMHGRLQGMLDGVFEMNAPEITRLLAQTDLLTRIVEDLRTTTLAEAGRLELHRDFVELRALAQECVNVMSQRLAASGLRVIVHGDPVTVYADRARLMQVIAAVLDNAARYAVQSEIADVTITSQGGDATLAVADRGPGLPKDATAKAFDWFWRADESRSRASGGSGLGLAVVQAIATAHGGRASVRHRDGGGAIFEISLPIFGRKHEQGESSTPLAK